MSTHRPPAWADVKRLFEQVSTVPKEEREALLVKLTSDDEALLQEVRSLLAASEEAETAMPVPQAETFAGWFDEEDPGFQLGRTLGPFKLIRELAQGGMGVVFEAEQDEPKRRVALKVLRIGLASDDARKRFEHEARILGNLSHPGIGALHGIGTHEAESGERVPYLIMELVRGARPVTQYVAQEGLDTDARLRVFLEVAEAVSAGHQRGIIHRDLKPDNVLVDEDGRAKVIDFGIARVTASDLDRGQVTETGMVMGTLGYIAPEQLAHQSAGDDVRMDVYALGVILYEMLTGHAPLDLAGLDVIAAVHATLEQRPTPATRYVPSMPRDLQLILGQGLAKDPDVRYASVEALARDVRAFLDSEPILARPPSWTYQLRLFTKRHRVGVLAGTIVLLALAGATWFSLRAAKRELDQRVAAERSEQVAMGASERAYGMLVGSQELVQGLSGDLYEELARVPGTLPARMKLVQQLEEGANALRVHAQDDERLQRMMGLLHLHVSVLNFSYGGDHLGRPKEALGALQRAKQSLELLVARKDVDPERHFYDRMHLAVVLGDEADILSQQGNVELAFKRSRLSISMLAALVKARPDSVSARNNMAGCLTRLARLARSVEDRAGALQHVRAAVDVLPEEEPDDVEAASMAYGNRGYAEALWGQLLRDEDKYDEARTHLLASLAAFEAGNRLKPDDPSARAKLAQAHGELGALAYKAGDGPTSFKHLQQALTLGREDLKHNPQDRRAQQSLQVDLGRMAKLQEAVGDKEKAVEAMAEAMAMTRSLAKEQPDSLFAQLELRIGLNGYGGVLVRMDQAQQATEVLEESHTLAKQLLNTHPDDPQTRLGWAEALDALGIARWTQAQGAPPTQQRPALVEALGLFEASLEAHNALERDGLLPTTHSKAAEQIGTKISICKQNLVALDAPEDK